MNFTLTLHRHLRWINLPTLTLLTLLQRTPVVRVLGAAGEFVLSSPVGVVLKSSLATAGALGAVNSLAGATEVQATATSPLSVATGTSTTVGFFVSGNIVSDPDAWMVDGSVPPGMSLSNLAAGTITVSGRPTTPGTYTIGVTATDAIGGSVGPLMFTFNVTGGSATAPSFSAHPQSQTVVAGNSVTFTATASGSPSPTYQWKKGSSNISGANGASYTIASVTAADAGSYTVVATNSAGSATSNAATLTVAPAAYLSNLSVRAASDAAKTLIAGFVVEGGAKPMLVRAGGPLLNRFGLTGASDPSVTLYNTSGAPVVVASNNDWNSTATPSSLFTSLGAQLFDAGSKDSALQQTISGPHTANVSVTNSGQVIAEVYDAGPNDGRQLTNLSARFQVGTGDNILIAGFVLAGTGTRQVLVRAVGAKLGDFGVTGFLADPQFTVFDGPTQIDTNNDWSSSLASTFTTLGAFSLNSGTGLPTNDTKSAAKVVTLTANKAYTVQVSGVGNTTGEALVEIYLVP